MAFCMHCGAHIDDGDSICPVCGEPVEDSSAVASVSQDPEPVQYEAPKSASQASATYIRQSASVQSGFDPAGMRGSASLPKLMENEVVVQNYQCCDLVLPRVEGFLTATNQRLIFHASGGNSQVNQSVAIESIGGIDAFYGMQLKWGLIIFGIIFILSSFSLFRATYSALAGLILLVIGGFMLYRGIRRCFYLSIYSKTQPGSPISIGEGAKGLLGSSALYSLRCQPTTDTDRMITQIGAVIKDIQTLGDLAVEKWS